MIGCYCVGEPYTVNGTLRLSNTPYTNLDRTEIDRSIDDYLAIFKLASLQSTLVRYG